MDVVLRFKISVGWMRVKFNRYFAQFNLIIPTLTSSHFMRNFFAVTILAAVLFSSLLHAQEEKTKSSFEFSFVAWENLSMPEILYKDGNNFHAIELIKRQRSKVYEFKRAQSEMRLYIQEVNGEGELVYKVVGRAAIKPASSRMLFFIQQRENKKEDELPLFLSGVDDSLDAFPMGSFRFINNTKMPMQVVFPSARAELPARASKVITPKIAKLGGFIPLYVLDMEKNVVFQSRFFAQPRGRKMVFISPPKKPGGKVHLAFLPHIVPIPLQDEDQ